MAQLPIYNSQQKLTTQAPEAIRTGAAEPYEAAGKVLAVTQEVAVKWSNALDTIQYTTAKANYETGVAQLEAKALVDPDYNAADKYYDELKKLKTANLKGFQNKSVESRMAFEIDNANQISQIKIGSIFKKKQIDIGQVKLQEGIDALQQKKVLTSSPAEYAKINNEIDMLLDVNAQAGIISLKDKDELKKKAELTGAENIVYSNPEQGIADLNAGLFNITAKDKQELITKANNLIKARTELADWQLKQIHTQGAFDLSQGLVNGTLTPGQIRGMQQSRRIDSETAAIFDGVLTKGEYLIPETTTLGKPEYFLRLLDDNLNDKTEVMKIVKDATTDYGKKELGANQYAYFIQEAKKRFDKQRNGLSPTDKILKASVESIKNFAINAVPPAGVIKLSYQLLSGFIQKLQSGQEPKQAEQEVIKEEVDQQLSNLNSEKKINVRRKSDGATGSMLEKDFNSGIYERVK